MSNGTSSRASDQAVVIEAQLDWITAGWNEGPSADRAEAWAFAVQGAEVRAGEHPKPFRLLGYEGTTVGRCRFGRRSDMALLQLSGDLAERHADDVLGTADRISRVDLAVTVRLPIADPFLGESTYGQASIWRAEHPTAALPSIIQDDDGGCTAYIGKRTSDRFLRVYNKEAECKERGDLAQLAHYANCWRYELEAKGTVAYPLLRLTSAASDRAAFIMSQVHTYCGDHGITPPFAPTHDAQLVPGFRRRSDNETRMGWLRRSVNPAILTMLSEVDRADIIEALGLGREGQVPARRADLS
jgi:hypothetical protein